MAGWRPPVGLGPRMRAILILLLISFVTAPVRAEDEPPAKDDVRRQVAGWIEGLRSEDFATRESARKQLKLHGLKAQDLLEAAKSDDDAEVRRTVRAILSRAPKRVTPDTAGLAPGDFRGLGTITLAAKGRPLGDVLAKMGEPVWAEFVVPERLAKAEVAFDLREAPFFAALQRVLAPHGMHVPRPFDALGTTAIEALPTGVKPAPWAAAGPMRVRVTEVSASRTLGSNAPRKYALTLELAWAPFVQVAQLETPKLEVARDPDGKGYRPTPAMNRNVTYGVSTSRRHHDFTIHIMPEAEDAKPQLGVLELALTTRLRFDPTRVTFDAKEALPQTKDGVTLHGIEAVEGSHGQYVVDFSAKLPDDVADRSLTAHILEPGGRLSTLGVYGGRSRSGDGTVRIRARAYRGNRGAPAGIRVAWHRREERGTLRFRLTDVPLR